MTRTQGARWLAMVLCTLAFSAVLFADAKSSGPEWLTSHPAAVKLAKDNKRVVLADFTGSDWCGYCIKLKKEVLDTDSFKGWAREKLVLLELDFPRKKAQSDELKKQNEELAKKFGVRGFPTVLFLDGEGKEIGRIVGFGGKDEWAKQAKDIVAKGKS